MKATSNAFDANFVLLAKIHGSYQNYAVNGDNLWAVARHLKALVDVYAEQAKSGQQLNIKAINAEAVGASKVGRGLNGNLPASLDQVTIKVPAGTSQHLSDLGIGYMISTAKGFIKMIKVIDGYEKLYAYKVVNALLKRLQPKTKKLF
jgi:hypothetical protein